MSTVPMRLAWIQDCPNCGAISGCVQSISLRNEMRCLRCGFYAQIAPPRPKVVTLCGSTRFWKTFQEQSLRLTLDGVIVLSVGAATASDADHGITPEQKAMLDELHKRKIDMSDEILVLNVDGYVGESTASEIAYAMAHMRRVRYVEHSEIGPSVPMFNRVSAERVSDALARERQRA